MSSSSSIVRAVRRRGSVGYRHDIDGLRGLAVALVVVFHVWMGRVSGGVDVFLSLSGFFFLGSLLRSASDPGTSLNPIPHLVRLVRRLYPVLVLAVAATMAGTMLVKPQTQWGSIFTQAVASLTYTQNWELARTSQDYGAADESISPLQHLKAGPRAAAAGAGAGPASPCDGGSGPSPLLWLSPGSVQAL